jgi:hypothetical protein
MPDSRGTVTAISWGSTAPLGLTARSTPSGTTGPTSHSQHRETGVIRSCPLARSSRLAPRTWAQSPVSVPYLAPWVSRRSESTGGTLYVTWSDYTNGDIDVFLSRSVDRGRTWSPRLRVNTDPVHNGADQFFQWMAVDPVTGAVYVQFYDRRGDPADRKTTVTLARSTDQGRTFTNYAWTTTPFDGHDVRLGDYMWLTVYDNRVYGAWAETAPTDTGAVTPRASRGYAPIVRVGTADFSKR